MSTVEKEKKVHIDDLHFEHQRWVKELKFYKDELPVFKSRLEEIASRYTDSEVLKELEHFQNQLYIHNNAIDELIHDINGHESEIAKYAESHPVAIDHVLFQDHAPLRDKIETNRRMVADLKQDFYKYLAKWM
ncbi:MAG: hypothetical protein R2813_02240 [Flavobacteriales bacterium]